MNGVLMSVMSGVWICVWGGDVALVPLWVIIPGVNEQPSMPSLSLSALVVICAPSIVMKTIKKTTFGAAITKEIRWCQIMV